MSEKSKPRRMKGEGSIHQREDGRWVGTLELGWRDGRRARKTVYGATQRETIEKLRAARRQVEQGIDPTPERLTVATFLDDWLQAVQSSLRPKVFHRYQEVVKVHLKPGLGRHRLAHLGPQHVQSFLEAKARVPRVRQANVKGSESRQLSPRTVQEIRTILVNALNKAVKWGLIPRNPAALVDGPRVPHQEIHPLTPEQAHALLGAARGHRLEALISVAISLGLRQGEALALTWDDVDLEAGFLHVRRALQRMKGGYELAETKTARSRRTVALPSVALGALREHHARQLRERLVAGARWDGRWSLVFCTRYGQPLHGPSVTLRFQKLLEEAGLPRQRFHDLRHACASLLLAQGEDLKVIQELLGHSTIAVTANTYSHVMNELKRGAAARMDAVLRPAGEAGR
jgi:integrase